MKHRINKGFIVQKLNNNIVIFDVEESILYNLNKTAAFIFKQLKKGLTEGEISKKLAKKYQSKEEKIKKDVHDFIRTLNKKKIIY